MDGGDRGREKRDGKRQPSGQTSFALAPSLDDHRLSQSAGRHLIPSQNSKIVTGIILVDSRIYKAVVLVISILHIIPLKLILFELYFEWKLNV